MRTSADSLVGRVLDGRYEVTSRIARGGMATVYLATDRRLDRDVAVKVMHAHLADDEQFIARFTREARAAARMSHPNVVSVYDQGEDGEIAFLVMEHVPGTTLRDLLTDREALTPGEALAVLEPLLDALGAAHRAGIVHRDVKPENVLLTDDARVKVADFGLARAASTSTTGATTGMLMGTAAYLSPELVLRGVADARSDVYAAGILLFEMLTGRQPFTGEVPIQVAYQHVNSPVPAPSDLDPGLPRELDDVVLRATARDPDDRPRDARELLEDVRRVRAGLPEPMLDRPPMAPELAARARHQGGGGLGGATPTDTVLATAVVRDDREHVAALPVGEANHPDGAAWDVTHDDDPDSREPSPRDRTPGGPDGAPPRRRRRGRGALALVLVLLLLVAGAGVGWWFTAGPGAYTTTPAVGTTAEAASADVEAAGLVPRVQEQYSETVAAGTVIGTDPAAGDRIRKGATVQVLVSVGSEFTGVPDLTNQTQDAATTLLADADLVLAEDPALEFSETVPQGSVVRQDPAPGATLRRGDPVAVVLSNGREPITVPSVVGQSQADADAALTGAGLTAAPSEASSTTVADGDVVSQDPADGTLFRGDAVSIVVSSGPPLVEVPVVRGQQEADARTALEALGFTVEVERVLGGFFGTVRSSDPEGGTSVPQGSTVTLTVV